METAHQGFGLRRLQDLLHQLVICQRTILLPHPSILSPIPSSIPFVQNLRRRVKHFIPDTYLALANIFLSGWRPALRSHLPIVDLSLLLPQASSALDLAWLQLVPYHLWAILTFILVTSIFYIRG